MMKDYLSFKIFYPCELAGSALEIDYVSMRERGVSALLFDVDNTLAPYDMADPPDEISELFQRLTGMGFKIALLSNNNGLRIERFSAGLDAVIVPKAGKPGINGVKRALDMLGCDASAAVIIGDQIFTDIWCANRAGIHSVLVKPVSKHEEYYIKLKRLLERIVMLRFLRGKKSNIASKVKRDYNDGGFTLLECVAALAIGAIVTCAVLYAAPSSGTRELEEACRALQADLRMAQRLSVIEGLRYRVDFDFYNNSYSVRKRLTASMSKLVLTRVLDGRVKLVYKTGNTESVEYTPTGTTGNPCKITLENTNYYANLTISLGSGRIAIKQFTAK